MKVAALGENQKMIALKYSPAQDFSLEQKGEIIGGD